MKTKTTSTAIQTRLLSSSHKIHSVYNPMSGILKFFKNGIEIDNRDMSEYTEEQLEKYLDGIEKGLKD